MVANCHLANRKKIWYLKLICTDFSRILVCWCIMALPSLSAIKCTVIDNKTCPHGSVANTLSCSAEGLVGWLAQRHGFNPRCRHVRFMSGFLHAMRLNSQTVTEPVSSIKCDRPSHPDWTEASGLWWEPPAWITDGRCLQLHNRAAPLAPCQRNPQANLGS